KATAEKEAEAACAPPAEPKPRRCAQEKTASDVACARTWTNSRPIARSRSARDVRTGSERKRLAASVAKNDGGRDGRSLGPQDDGGRLGQRSPGRHDDGVDGGEPD